MRVIRRVYNYTFAFQSCDLEVPAVGTGSTSTIIKIVYPPKEPVSLPYFNYLNVIRVFN